MYHDDYYLNQYIDSEIFEPRWEKILVTSLAGLKSNR